MPFYRDAELAQDYGRSLNNIANLTMSCSQNAKKAAKVASATGIPNLSSQTGAEVGRAGEVVYYLPPEWRKKGSHHPQPLPWPPAGRQRRGFWGDYRQRIKYALEAWRSEADDRTLARLRAELASDLVEQQVARVQSSDHPAGIAGDLAEERAALLLFPPRSISAAERVERVAVLDNAIALLRLKQAIDDSQYRFAVVDTVCNLREGAIPSTTPITWLPGRPAGTETDASSSVDPTRKIRVRYRVVELVEPITSNTLTGEINPTYIQTLQPRQRERAASMMQIDGIAKNLDKDALLKTAANWSDGPPLIGPDGMVESGNGRLLALRWAVEINPPGYNAYRQQLTEQANRFGLNAAEIAQMTQPVLVRERLTELDENARVRFVNEANASGVARQGLSEQARADARLIPPGFFADFQIGESDTSLADVLSRRTNVPVVARFPNLLPETERPALMDSHGELSVEGVNRLERALFAYALPGSAGERLARLIFEESESIDRIGTGLRQALPKLGQMEDLIRAGQRAREFSLGADVAAAVEKMRDLRGQGLSINDYLRQYKMFPELSPFQEQLLLQLDERRKSGRAVAELFNAYADEVIRMAPTNQASLFGQDTKMSREEALRTALKKIGGTWVDLQHWSAAQRAISGLDIPASQIQRLTPAQQRKAMKIAILS